MTRARAGDYDDKRNAILEAATAVFAAQSYPNSKMQDIAVRCNGSKSLLYYYFSSKEDVLFAILKDYSHSMLASLDGIELLAVTPIEKFTLFVESYITKSAKLRRCHTVLVQAERYLPPPQRSEIRKLSRAMLNRVSALLLQVNPDLAANTVLLKPFTLVLFGSLNGLNEWFRPRGALTAKQISSRVSRQFLNGFLREQAQGG